MFGLELSEQDPLKPETLAYIGIRTTDIGDWRRYGPEIAGFQLADSSRDGATFRMDERASRIFATQADGNGIAFLGWELSGPDALESFCGKLDRLGIKFQRGGTDLAARRHVADLIWLEDPLGLRVELCWGALEGEDPFRPGRTHSGFRTGSLGLGHLAMSVEDVRPVVRFYRDVLGFRVSDYFEQPFPAVFFHINPRHHSLAFIQGPKTGVHHLMIEHFSLDDVGQGYDLVQLEEGRLMVSLGRHAGDYMTSYYSKTPSGFLIEHGWGGRLVDVANWVPQQRSEGPSIWGHERYWATDEVRAKALAQRLENARRGLRRPVQVCPGNHMLMDSGCPAWDARLAYPPARAAPPEGISDLIDME